jgi:hypothetical protein
VSTVKEDLDVDQMAACLFDALASEIRRHALLQTVPTQADIARWERQLDLLDFDWRRTVMHHEGLASSPAPRLYLVKPYDPAGGVR